MSRSLPCNLGDFTQVASAHLMIKVNMMGFTVWGEELIWNTIIRYTRWNLHLGDAYGKLNIINRRRLTNGQKA